MAYRRTDRVVRRLAARREAILAAARTAAAEGGMAAVHIAAVAARADIAAGTVYRYFPAKADLVTELVTSIAEQEVEAMRRAADAAPGPLSALAAALCTFAARAARHRQLTWAIIAEPAEVDISAARIAVRRSLAAEFEARIVAAMQGGHLPDQDAALAAAALVGALLEGLVGPLAEAVDEAPEPGKRRAAVQMLMLLALRGLGVVDARARGLVVQTAMPPTDEPG